MNISKLLKDKTLTFDGRKSVAFVSLSNMRGTNASYVGQVTLDGKPNGIGRAFHISGYNHEG